MPVIRVNDELWELVEKHGKHGESRGAVVLRLIRDGIEDKAVGDGARRVELRMRLEKMGESTVSAKEILKLMEELE